jgi:hypothetical protein
MAKRPSSISRLAKNAISIAEGMLLEVIFIIGIILFVFGIAGIGLLIWQLVG